MAEPTRRPSASLARRGALLPDHDAGDRLRRTPVPLRRVLRLPRFQECFDAGHVGHLAQSGLAQSGLAVSEIKGPTSTL